MSFFLLAAIRAATNAGVDPNGNVWASVNGGADQCSGDCPVSSVTVNGGSPSMVDTITSTLTGVGKQVLNTAQNAGALICTPFSEQVRV
jgi:hypothetical protein